MKLQSCRNSANKDLRLSYALLLSVPLLFVSACGGGGTGGGGGTSPTVTSVTVTCTPTSVQTGQTSQCSATVTGTGSYSSAVTWSAVSGTVSSSGVYTAPATIPASGSDTIKAISTEDSTKSGTATVTVTPAIVVSVTPTTASVEVGSTQQFAATVLNSTNSAVTWQVNGVAGGNAALGTISMTGLYTAPSAVPSPATITVTAVAQADSTKSASATVTVTPAIVVSVTPTTASLEVGSTQQFAATVSNSSNSAVTWQVNGVAGGNAALGTISMTGLYTAPTSVPSPATITVTAVAQADSTKSASATVTVTPAIVVSVTPTTASLEVGSTQQFAATVSNSSNSAVTWQVNGIAGGNAALGTVSTTGLYTAPSAVPSPATITVTAVAQADSTKSASATVTVTPAIVVSVTPSFATVAPGATQQFTATVQNTADVAVTWQVNGTTGGSATTGTISVDGLYTAPTAPPATGTVVITAVSVADPSKSGSASISIFSNANLNGTYNFVFGGIYSLNPGAYTSGSGTFTANGAGQITSGSYTMSEIGFVTPCSGALSGSYSVSSNGTGSAALTAIANSASAADGCTTPAPLDFSLVVSASGETVGLGLADDGFEEFNGMTDNSAFGYLYGSGIAMQQGVTSSDANITGKYNYVLAGMPPDMNSYTSDWGDFFPNGAGQITAGSYGTNNLGSSTVCDGSLSGSYSVDTNGSGDATIAALDTSSCSNATFDFSLAVTASGDALGLQESDNSGTEGLFGAGIAIQQGSPTIATISGVYNYVFMGVDPSRSAAEFLSGSFTANGAGQITGGSYTMNEVGFSTPCTGSLSGSYGVNGTGGATLTAVPNPASAANGCPNETILFSIDINPSGNTLGLVLEEPSCMPVEDACNIPGYGMGLAVK
jgi:hypothetical protein